MAGPQTLYAKSGQVSIAYQVVCDGPVDLVLVTGFVSHVEVAWEEPRLAHLLSRLASFSRLLVFDKRGGMDRAWASGEWWDGGSPSPSDDARHRVWWARYLRMAASPSMAQNVIRMNMQMDIRDLLPTIGQPVLVLHRTGDMWIDVGHARYLAEHLPAASYVELPGTDHRPWLGDAEAIADEVEVFLTGRKSRPRRRTALGVDALSRREHEVALLAAWGVTAAEIASHLCLSKRTVESHLVSVYRKLGVRSKNELIRSAAEFGM